MLVSEVGFNGMSVAEFAEKSKGIREFSFHEGTVWDAVDKAELYYQPSDEMEAKLKESLARHFGSRLSQRNNHITVDNILYVIFGHQIPSFANYSVEARPVTQKPWEQQEFDLLREIDQTFQGTGVEGIPGYGKVFFRGEILNSVDEQKFCHFCRKEMVSAEARQSWIDSHPGMAELELPESICQKCLEDATKDAD